MEREQQREARDVAVQMAALVTGAALQAWVIWLSLPPQQRFWIRLEALGWLRRVTGRAARAEGHAGMGEELSTGQRSARYLSAWGLGIAREWAVQRLEEMRP